MITNKYIKMCEKAEEIQKDWKPEDGDKYIYILGKKREIVVWMYGDINSTWEEGCKLIWYIGGER